MTGAANVTTGQWWVTTGPLDRGGKKVIGPFSSPSLAMGVRTYVEKAERRTDLWVWEDK